MKNIRILFVPGIHSVQWYLHWWKKDLEKAFPHCERVFLDEVIYCYWQHEKMRGIVQKGVDIIDDGKPTIILAHSFGGILSKAIIEQSKKKNIVHFITMASPHNLDYAGVKKAKEAVCAPRNMDVSTESLGGYFDVIVPFFFSRFSQKKKHQNLWGEHMSFLWWPPFRKRVIQIINAHIKKEH